MRFTSLAHVMDEEFLKAAWQRVRKDGAVGVDQQSAKEYAANLDANLRELCERLRSGRYKAPPVRRVWIPKDGGKQRPLGIPTTEDKLVQRAVAMILEAVHEQDLLDCSHGFRPKPLIFVDGGRPQVEVSLPASGERVREARVRGSASWRRPTASSKSPSRAKSAGSPPKMPAAIATPSACRCQRESPSGSCNRSRIRSATSCCVTRVLMARSRRSKSPGATAWSSRW